MIRQEFKKISFEHLPEINLTQKDIHNHKIMLRK